MGKPSRDKGGRGEREIRRLLQDHLGTEVSRRLSQAIDGGYDLDGIAGIALEVKRCEKLEIGKWWRQACEQADKAGLVPALAYRKSRQPWRFVVPLGVFMGNTAPWGQQAIATVDIDGFALIVREMVNVES